MEKMDFPTPIAPYLDSSTASPPQTTINYNSTSNIWIAGNKDGVWPTTR